MPEIAEVETVRRTLLNKILNKKIKEVKVLYPNIIENEVLEFTSKLKGEMITDIQRKGKWLIFYTNHYALVSHLRMEGKYFIKNSDEEIVKHEHVIFSFENNMDLRYHDTRKFGRMKLMNKEEVKSYLNDLGPDANQDIDPVYLYNKIKDKKLPIKGLLLDQSIIAGLGNIYVDEVLYEAALRPTVLGCELDLKDCENIIKASGKIISKAIEYKGTTIRSYTSSLGVKGEYQQFLKVHTKDVCKCGNKITKEKVCGRTSYYCSKCQKSKEIAK